MKKYTSLFFSAVALLLMASCAKVDEISGPDAFVASPDGLRITASLNTRSVFEDKWAYSLKWENTDNIGVYSLKINDILGGSATFGSLIQNAAFFKDFAQISINGANPDEASFATARTKYDFVGGTEGDNDDKYLFWAYYPAVQNALKVPAVYTDQNSESYLGFSHTVAEVQNGKFGDYHVCYSADLTTGISDGEDISGNSHVYSRSDVLQGTPVIFDGFQPATSMIRFRMKADSDITISSVTISSETDDIAGSAQFWPAASPVMWPESAKTGSDENNSKSVTVNFGENINLTTDAFSDYYCAVIIPTTASSKFTIAATDQNGAVIVATKDSPEGGFLPGMRYNLDLTLHTQPKWFAASLPEADYKASILLGSVTSYKLDGEGNVIPLPWAVDGFYSDAEGNTLLDPVPDWIVKYTNQGVGSTSSEDDEFTVNVAYNSTAEPQMTFVEAQIRDGLRGKPLVGSPSNFYNLSNATGAAAIQNTANCYIINAAGYYRFPLVLGNGIKDGTVNTTAFTSSLTTQNPLNIFHDYLDGEIVSPYVHESSENVGTPTTVDIVWEDVEHLVYADETTWQLKLDEGAVLRRDANDIFWVYLYIPQATIDQGNAVIAVKDEQGRVMWSWHLWVTDYNTASDDIRISHNVTRNELLEMGASPDELEDFEELTTDFTFMSRNLGWSMTHFSPQYSVEGREIYVKLTQTDGDETSSILVPIKQSGVTLPAGQQWGNNPFYQAGRKDPILPYGGANWVDNSFIEKTVWGTVTGYQQAMETGLTIGSGIQRPGVLLVSQDSHEFWYTDPHTNLWSSERDGEEELEHLQPTQVVKDRGLTKTIYDPCPVGYHVQSNLLEMILFSTAFRDLDDLEDAQFLAYFAQKLLCSASKYGTSLYTDDTKTSTIFFPTAGVRGEGINSDEVQENQIGEAIYHYALPGVWAGEEATLKLRAWAGWLMSWPNANIFLILDPMSIGGCIRPVRDDLD